MDSIELSQKLIDNIKNELLKLHIRTTVIAEHSQAYAEMNELEMTDEEFLIAKQFFGDSREIKGMIIAYENIVNMICKKLGLDITLDDLKNDE